MFHIKIQYGYIVYNIVKRHTLSKEPNYMVLRWIKAIWWILDTSAPTTLAPTTSVQLTTSAHFGKYTPPPSSREGHSTIYFQKIYLKVFICKRKMFRYIWNKLNTLICIHFFSEVASKKSRKDTASIYTIF